GPDVEWLDPIKGRFDTYFAKTGDWRGNKSFFRSGFCYDMSTQNFNTTSAAGALLAGALIDSKLAMADGRHGIETYPLRMYCWSDGSGQEHIDHYYFAVTLAGNKAVADFSQTPYDRLIGQSLLAKNVEELVSAYHPGLRSFIAGSSRTGLDLVLGMQDGLQHVMHTLSKSGAEKDLGTTTLPGNIATFGHDIPPHQVAQQTLAGPWAPEWVTTMVDEKPLPYEAKHTGWGGVRRTCYLGRNYGMASNAVNIGRIQVMAQWRREPRQVASMTELGTLDLRHGIDQTLWANDGQGRITPFGTTSVVQHRNKIVALMSPPKEINPEAKSLQASIGLFNFQQPEPTWEIYVDGRRVEHLPFTCKQGQRITIEDGVTWLGILPLKATDLGRDAEVVLQQGPAQKAAYYKSDFGAALTIDSYHYRGEKPLGTLDKNAIDRAYGGFVVEIADVGDFADFAAFSRHFAQTTVEQSFDDANSTLTVKYTSGDDTLEAASVTTAESANLTTWLVNGEDPNLSEGIERDTPYCQQGLARVAKNGAVLEAGAERRVCLLTEPKAGVYCGWNPLPDLTNYKLTVPGGLTVTADGKVGLARVVVRPRENRIDIDHAFKPGQENEPGTAREMLIYGAKTEPRITLGGKPIEHVKTRTIDGQTAYAVPLQ
ncbi:MAG TPA: hypothetical protein VE890_09970, partial [Thermoguttaceae bacterium]|nr:hypothetical protein [Thermoguttaceae bacterium]